MDTSKKWKILWTLVILLATAGDIIDMKLNHTWYVYRHWTWKELHSMHRYINHKTSEASKNLVRLINHNWYIQSYRWWNIYLESRCCNCKIQQSWNFQSGTFWLASFMILYHSATVFWFGIVQSPHGSCSMTAAVVKHLCHNSLWFSYHTWLNGQVSWHKGNTDYLL